MRRWGVGGMVGQISLGIVGVSKDNGHPYSFSAIVNGYHKELMIKAGWEVICNYLEERDPSEFGFANTKITHVWTQDINESKKIAEATLIPHVVNHYEEMVHKVDGLIIARDDPDSHFGIAKPFLDAGKSVFIDKPLSLEKKELRYFKPFLESGKLMSCSGLRYAREIDFLRKEETINKAKLIRGAVINSWEKYAIHLLDAIYSLIDFKVKSVLAIESRHRTVIIKNKDLSIIEIDALGNSAKTFKIDFWTDTDRYHAEITDNFSAFRRTLYHFIQMIRTGSPKIEPEITLNIMRILIAGNISLSEKREVSLDEIRI